MTGRQGLRSRLVTGWALLGLFAVGALPATVSAVPARDGPPVVYLGAQRIKPSETLDLYCHDRDYPVIRCFLTGEQRATEQVQAAGGSEAAALTPTVSALLSPYVRWYRDANFTGPSFEAYLSEPSLAAIGWDNQISSFTSLNGGHPVWWSGPNQSGTKWDWGTASAGVLGSANDQFSSVAKT